MATATKTKKKVFTNVTLEQAQEASRQYAVRQTQLASIEAKMNTEINKVKDKYKDQVTELKEMLDEPVAVLEAYATANKDSWKKKSMELLHTVIGFRTGNPKVDKKSAFTWKAVLELLQQHKMKRFIRTIEEINKEEILALDAEKDKALLNQLKENAGVFISQDESFYVELKKEDVQQDAVIK
jgi:phage host-nuclease inhibitor protein Gam